MSGCASSPRAPAAADRATPRHVTGTPIPADVGREAVMQAMSMLGVRYKSGGNSPESGFDCSGLVAYAFARVAPGPLPRTTGGLSRSGIDVDARDLRPGDLVFYNTQQRPYSHVGIYLGDSRFIHAPSSGGVVRIEDMHLRYWVRRFNGARRITL